MLNAYPRIDAVSHSGRDYQVTDTGTYFNAATPHEVIRRLDDARRGGARVRIYYGDTKGKNAGRAWLEEHDVIGTIGRSTGAVKIPLMIANSRSMGGGGLLDHCVVAIQDVASKRFIYKHASFRLPRITLKPSDIEGYAMTAYVGRKPYARFKTDERARNWLAFMRGERMRAA